MNIIQDSSKVWRGPAPATLDDVNFLASRGIKTILNLQSDSLEFDEVVLEAARARRMDMRFAHVPMSMIIPPSWATLRRAVEALFVAVGHGPVYVHCKDGVDRTGCVLWAWDVWLLKRPSAAAYREMLSDGFHVWRYFWWLPFVAYSIKEGL